MFSCLFTSSDIFIGVGIVRWSFHVFSLQKTFDSRFHHRCLQKRPIRKRFVRSVDQSYGNRKFQLSEHFGDQLSVRQRLSGLHNPHHRCIDLIMSILNNTLRCRTVLLRLEETQNSFAFEQFLFQPFLLVALDWFWYELIYGRRTCSRWIDRWDWSLCSARTRNSRLREKKMDETTLPSVF